MMDEHWVVFRRGYGYPAYYYRWAYSTLLRACAI